MPKIHFDRFYRHEDLTQLLQAYAKEYPKLVQVESIGKSHEDRDIWLITVTNTETGPAEEKPALWVEGNIHATEVVSSTACLYHLNQLVKQYSKDENITRCLDTRVFYIVPRLNPDGAEWALADIPKYIRSGTRPYPYNEDPVEGLIMEDVDGDGRVLSMRLEDPNGPWKTHPDDPRIMIHRDPAESSGTYYRLLPEGRYENYDGHLIKVNRNKEGLDFNRNFPSNWRSEGEQLGAGDYPTSEPEIRAAVEFITADPNITGGITFHTWSGVLLRPFDGKADDEFAAEDLWTYKKIGDKGTEITDYPNISVFHDFKYHPKQVISGSWDEWMFEFTGRFAWTVEIWAPMREAGIKDYKHIDWYREHPVEDDIAMMKWNDEKLDGKGYIDWYEYDHPQLGKVEIGGWDTFHAIRNPSFKFMETEVAKFPDWLTWHLLISPKLETVEASAHKVGDDTYRILFVIQNTGWLPTYITKKAVEKKFVRDVVCEIELPKGAKLETGKARQEIGQLEGKAYLSQSTFFQSDNSTTDRQKIEWVVQTPKGGTVKLTARHERAGVVRAEVELK